MYPSTMKWTSLTNLFKNIYNFKEKNVYVSIKNLNEDTKVFVKGRVSEEDDNASKLICELLIPFEDVPSELWIQFPDIFLLLHRSIF